MSTAGWNTGIRVVAGLCLAIGSMSCGTLTRQGTSPAYLIVDELVASSGADPGNFGATLFSDVQTIVDDRPTTFADLGRVSFSLGLKDPGPATGPTQPSQNNFITVERYHVKFIRADGRNTQGVDVPYEFDGALTDTVKGELSESFELVRHVAKEEAPLGSLRNSPVVIHTIAEITFYGHDQTGRTASTTARISVEFGNFADPS